MVLAMLRLGEGSTEPGASFELGTRRLTDVQWGSAVLVTFGYCFLVFVGVRRMERRLSVDPAAWLHSSTASKSLSDAR